MKRYFHFYKTLLKLNFARLVIYKSNLINNIISSVCWGGFLIVQILLVTSKTSTIYGWSKEQVLLLAATFNLIIGLFHMLFSRNFARFSLIIDKGDLDFYLLKPIDSQLLLTTSVINLASFFRVILGVGFTIYVLSILQTTITIATLLLYIILVMFGILILYSIWFMVSTLIIWFTRLSNLIDFLYTLNGISRLPPGFINEIKNIFLIFFLPFTFVAATPTEVIMNHISESDIASMFVTAILLFFLSRWFWHKSLQYYTSASS